MSHRALRIAKLRLDLKNPRIAQASNQREALKKIINDQDMKLVMLAESIVENGLNPMDRFLVIQSEEEKTKFTVIEGNRRFAAVKILQNPTVLTGLEVRPSIQKRLEVLAAGFNVTSIEPLDCFEVAAREDGAMWIQQRHTGENGGRGIVNWNGVARARFRGSDPALQALDFALVHGDFADSEKDEVSSDFPISTLDRLLSTPAVRDIIGMEIRNGKLLTGLPFEEARKPLLRIVRDLSSSIVTVTDLKLQPQMVKYASELGDDLPDLTKLSTKTTAVDDLSPPVGESSKGEDDGPGGESGGNGRTGGSGGGTASRRRTKTPKPRARKTLIEKSSYINVTNSKIAEIESELRSLLIADHPHAISVLLRVFLELSVDQYLDRHGIPLRHSASGTRIVDKSLRNKVGEAVQHMIGTGTPGKELDGITKGIDNQHNPLYIDTLHNYIHNAFYSPTERDLTVAWDNAVPFFTKIWP